MEWNESMRLDIKSRDFYRLLDDLSQGVKVYAVGGSVRDQMMSNSPHDIDIAVGQPIEWILNYFLESKPAYIKNINQVGVSFGIIKVVLTDGTNIDIAQFRTETYTDESRKPDTVTFVKTIEEDLARRDFTINAMALLYLGSGEFQLIDPFGGLEDLHNGIIKAVGNPEDRLKEDPLRIQRGIRFKVKFGFTIEQKLAEAMEKLGYLLEA